MSVWSITVAAVILVLTCLAALYGQAPAKMPLLEEAYSAAQDVPLEERAEPLSEIIRVAVGTNHGQAAAWTRELEQVIDKGRLSPCERAQFQAHAVTAWAKLDLSLAVTRLVSVDDACPRPFEVAASEVFGALFTSSRQDSVEDIVSLAKHLGKVGDYPYRATRTLLSRPEIDRLSFQQFFSDAVTWYKGNSVRQWNAHDDFLELIRVGRKLASDAAISEALDVAIRRIADTPLEIAERSGMRMSAVMRDSAVRQVSPRDRTIAKLEELAIQVDPKYQTRIRDTFAQQRLPDIDRSQMVAGVVAPANMPLPSGVRFKMDLVRIRTELKPTVSAAELESLPVSTPLRVALLALRGAESSNVDRSGSDDLFQKADKLSVRMGQDLDALQALTSLIESAAATGRDGTSKAALERLFSIAPALAEKESRETQRPLAVTSAFGSMKRALLAINSDKAYLLSVVRPLNSAAVRSQLLVTLAAEGTAE